MEVALVTPTQAHLLQVFMLMMDRQVVVVVEADHLYPEQIRSNGGRVYPEKKQTRVKLGTVRGVRVLTTRSIL